MMKRDLIIACCLLAVLFSCAHPRKAEFESVSTQSQINFDTGEYQKALDGYRRLHARFPKDPDLADSYINMFESVKKQSDRAYARGEYAAAYRIYRLLPDYYDDFTGHQKKLSFLKSFLNERIKLSQIKLAENTSKQYLLSGDFQKAIDVCREIYRKDAQAQECLMTASAEIGGKGNTAYNKGEYSGAAKIYLVLRKNTEIFKTAGISAAPDIRTINTRLANCSTYLNKKGLELYRKGDLRKALEIWKEILEFDPDNAEVRKSVDTTSAQIKNMQ